MAKYKDAQGRFMTRGLFDETISSELRAKMEPPFTLADEDKGKYKSLKQIYMSYDSPSEYDFAMDIFDSWPHWDKLSNCTWFIPYLEAWQEEKEIKMRGLGIKRMADLAASGNINAAKWIAEGGWIEKKAGRPTKEKVKGELKKQARIKQDLSDDAARIGFVKK